MASYEIEASDSDDEASCSSEWHQKPIFQRYWKQYNQCHAWANAWASGSQSSCSINSVSYNHWHKSMADYHRQCAAYMQQCGAKYMQMASTMMGFKVPSVPNQQPKKKKKKKRKRKRIAKKEEKKVRRSKKKSVLFSDLEDLPSDMEFVLDMSGEMKSTPGVEYHMELSEDMLEFFAQSAKHKQERDASRQTVSGQDDQVDEEHTDLTSVSAHRLHPATSCAPKEQPGSLRASEMRELYGKGSAMIHAMETAMQLSYQRSCDMQQPQLWPQLPLNIQFE